MVDCASFNSRFENACWYVLQKFGLDHFKGETESCKIIKELILGQVIFVILPTGSGKSLIFQAFLLVLDHFEGNQSSHQPIAVVISPLVSDMSYLI